MTDQLLSAYTLPEHWPAKRLRFLASINALTLPEDTAPERVLRYMDISSVNGDGSTNDAQEMPFENAPTRARRLTILGDTVISTVRTYLKAITFVDHSCADCTWSTGFTTVTPSPELHPRFLYYVARSNWFIAEIQRRAVGVSYPAVSPEDISDILCPVPPLDEQRRISDLLDTEVEKIDQLTRRLATLAELLAERRNAVVTAAVIGELDPSSRRQTGATV
jgi:type I restriction enzyme S subunit